jgi:hypothetical protein
MFEPRSRHRYDGNDKRPGRSRRNDDAEDGDRPRRRKRRRTCNPALVALIVLLIVMPILAGGGYLIYRLAKSSGLDSTPVAAKDDGAELEKFKKRLIGKWEADLVRDGVARKLYIEYKADGTSSANGFVNGRRVGKQGRWEALKVEGDKLRVRSTVDGVSIELLYEFPSIDEYRYMGPDEGQVITARRSK